MRRIAVGFAIIGIAICAFAAWKELSASQPRYVELASLSVLTLTLIVLVWYAYDTNMIAGLTGERWRREGILGTTYGILLADPAARGSAGRTLLQLTNNSPLVVRATVNLDLRVYGNAVTAGDLYDGRRRWVLYPHQMSQGWFEIESILRQQGRTVAALQNEASDENQVRQVTMNLQLQFEDEFGEKRTLPPRQHYFDFRRWAWIPSLGE